MWAGIAGAVVNNNTGYELAISINDSVYNTDFASSVIPYTANNPEAQASQIEKHVIDVLRKFCTEHMCKFLGAGVTVSLLREVRLLLNKVCSENASGSSELWVRISLRSLPGRRAALGPPPRCGIRKGLR